jgi:ribonuclease HI
MGSSKEHTVHEAELAGILLGLHLAKTEKGRHADIMIGVDNQAAIKAFQSDLRKPGHHLAREALLTGNRLQKMRSGAKRVITIRWTAGHQGIEGNEIADQEAKLAAQGNSSDTKSLPRYLRRKALINPSAIKQAHKEKLKRVWAKQWRESERGKRSRQLDDTAPSSKFLKLISHKEVGRKTASIISQLRTAHVPLNSYLHKIGKIPNSRCPACNNPKEDPAHFLLACPAYAHERWALTQSLRKLKKALNLKSLS